MTKRLIVFLMAMVMVIAAMAFPALASEDVALPPYESHILTEAEMDEFFDASSFKYGGVEVAYIYEKLADPTGVIYAMNFTAVEDYATASAAPYADYIADFVLVSDRDVAVLLAGAYGSYGTIPVGIVELKAGEPVRVMKTAADLGYPFSLTYEEVVNMVGSFNCAAMPLTEEVLEAYYELMCESDSAYAAENPVYNDDVKADLIATLADPNGGFNPLGSETFTVAPNGTTMGLDLTLYENDPTSSDKYAETGNSWAVGETKEFSYLSLPPYDSHILTADERAELFNASNFNYGGEEVSSVYSKLTDAEKWVYAMNFAAVEDYNTAAEAPYGNYIADFELTASKDTAVLLVGNYDKWKETTIGTVPLGIVNLKAGEPLRILETARAAGQDTWNFTYKEIVLRVNSFDCAALPLSNELLKAYYDVKCEDAAYAAANPVFNTTVRDALITELLASANPLNAASFTLTEDDTEFSLALKLYENDNSTPNVGDTKYDETGVSWIVGETTEFTYNAELDVPEVAAPTIMDKMLVVYNMETKVQDGKTYYPIHVYSGIDHLSYNEVGYKMVVKNIATGTTATQTKSTNVVYEAMNVTKANGTVAKYIAADLGTNCNFMFGHEILFTTGTWTNANTELTVTPYAIDKSGNEITGKTIVLTDAAIKEKDPTSSMFKEAN